MNFFTGDFRCGIRIQIIRLRNFFNFGDQIRACNPGVK